MGATCTRFKKQEPNEQQINKILPIGSDLRPSLGCTWIKKNSQLFYKDTRNRNWQGGTSLRNGDEQVSVSGGVLQPVFLDTTATVQTFDFLQRNAGWKGGDRGHRITARGTADTGMKRKRQLLVEKEDGGQGIAPCSVARNPSSIPCSTFCLLIHVSTLHEKGVINLLLAGRSLQCGQLSLTSIQPRIVHLPDINISLFGQQAGREWKRCSPNDATRNVNQK